MGIASSMKELVENIASSHEERAKTVLSIKEEAKRIAGDARALIEGFQTARQETGAELRQDLAQDKANRKTDVTRTLAGFQASRQKEGAQLRKELAQGVAERRPEVKALVEDAQKLVTGFAESREETGKALRKNLASAAKEIVSEVKEMRNSFRQSQAPVRADINEARDAWRELTRGKVAKKPVAKAKAVEAVPVEEESPDLESKLLAAIIKHPAGITLTEVAESLGVPPVVFGRAARKLVDKGKIRKEDKVYFPVASIV